MTKRPTGKPSAKLRRGTQELLERRGMAAGVGGRPRAFGPVLHTATKGGTGVATHGTYAALTGMDTFSHGGRRLPEERALTGALPAHTELKGHRHRGAEQHSKH
ncbi:hypothetical protein GCM10009665_13880 [Kitasatospora nipponensis]|uniref:Uncharacterized protein n=1 Tax=Kitasatospora nipponensis TaxID=258049 RepID=A0ABP4GL83_9ACTN